MGVRKAPRSLRINYPLGLAAAGAVMAAAGSAQAQTATAAAQAAVTLEGVQVVRGRPNLTEYVDPEAPYKADYSASSKLTQPLLDTPKSVVVVTKDVMDDLGATSFRDLMRTQPGVTLGTGEGGNAYGDRIFVRGFDARNDIYIDGVRDPGVGARETFDIDQVEILKGPNSTIAGRGTTGGAVSLVSKQPLDRNFNDLELTVGTDSSRRATYDVNHRINDQLRVRLNLMAHGGDIAGRDAVFNNRWGAAAAISWRPTETTEVGFDYYHLSTKEMPDFGVPYDLPNNRPFGTISRRSFYGVVSRDFRRTFADIYTARAQWTASDRFSLNTILRYGQSLNAYTASAPEAPNVVARTVNANPKRRDAVTDTWASQTNARLLLDTGPLQHTLVAGFEISNETVMNRGRAFVECATLPCTGAAAAVVQNLYTPNPYVQRAVTDNGLTSRTTANVFSQAGYLIDTIRYGEHWELLTGLRYDRYDIDFKQITYATGAVVRRGNEVGFWNGQVGLTYKPVAEASLYAAFGTSSNPSGEQLDSTSLDYGGLDPRTSALKPERNKSYEVGGKWNVLDGHLALTAALFRIDKVNARVTVDANTVLLAGRQKAQGVELTATGNITPRWSVFGGYTFLDAKITDSPTASQVGARFPNVPRHSASLTTKYRVLKRLTLGGTATYNSRRYGGTVSALNTSIPGFTRYDLFGTIQVTRQFAIDFNILNLTDKVYYDALYRSATPFTYVAPGRAMLIKADFHF